MPPLSGMQTLGPASVQPLQPNKGFLSGLGEFFLGQAPQQITQQRFTPQQMNLLNMLGQRGLQGIGNVDFEPIAQLARQGFQEKTVPSIAERFAGTGGLSSGAFQRQISQAGSNLESQLAGLRSQHQLGQQPLFAQLLGLASQPQFDQAITQPSTGLLGSLLGNEAGTKGLTSGGSQAGSALVSLLKTILGAAA